MLEPQGRRHLMEALRPPPGYELDRAIGTTYSLDLLALLTAPLAFTLFAWEDEDGSPTADPLALFESLRRYADRISIFCQAGQISIPATRQPLLGYLERSVCEVTAPKKDGVFHPKIWALRFICEGEPVMYRLLVLSRNLTFDRSWDTILVLEGELSDRKNAFGMNHPLGDFFATLPGRAIHKVPNKVSESVDLVQSELRRVWFEPPDGFESIAFWPLGLSRSRQWPFYDVRRMLVVSPFVSDTLLNRLPGRSGGVLVSRPEALENLDPATIEAFDCAYVLRQEAEPEDEVPEGETAMPPAEEPADLFEEEGETLTGLHAKLFVADDGWDARIWTGSANATNAAFSRNVEFLVELAGKKSVCGVDVALSQPGDATGFADLLQRYEPGLEMPEPDQVRKALEGRADEVRQSLAASRITATISPSPGETDLYTVRLSSGDSVKMTQDVSVRCWPLTLPPDRAITAEAGATEIARFNLSLEALTSFFAFKVTASDGSTSFSRRFVLNVALEGAPEGRHESIVRSLLSDKDQVMRLILFLLAEGGPDETQTSIITGPLPGGDGSGNGSGGLPGIPLFEEMVRALWTNPKALDRIEEMLATLRASEEGAQLIPEELDEIWGPLMQTRKKAGV